MNTIKGIFCCLDISDFPIELSRAKDLVSYFDDKYPKIANLLKAPNYPKEVYVFTNKDNCMAQKFNHDKIKFTPNPENQNCITARNKGF